MAVKSKKITVPLIVVGSLVAAVLIFGLVLGLLRAPIMPDIKEPVSIQIITSGGYSSAGNNTAVEVMSNVEEGNPKKAQFNKLFNAINKSSDYSQLTMSFENKWFKSFSLTTVKDEDGDTQHKTLSVSDINAIAANQAEGKYLLVFRYLNKGMQSITIDGVDIEYNAVYMLVKDSNNAVASLNMYFVDTNALDAVKDNIVIEDEVTEYTAYEVNAWSRQTEIVKVIKDIIG